MSARRLLLGLLPVLLAGVLLLGLPALPAPGQEAPTPSASSATPDDGQFDPDLGQEPIGTGPEEPTSEEPIDPDDATRPEEGEGEVSNETIQQAGWGSASD
ncbi:MAG: hypothetical protein H0U42_00365, partial [Thermoleophilaceae bacterium]|nr:hypothetical protein [Thermoleophilaceae bacterium]